MYDIEIASEEEFKEKYPEKYTQFINYIEKYGIDISKYTFCQYNSFEEFEDIAYECNEDPDTSLVVELYNGKIEGITLAND